ncbi:exosortase F system-associated membrane protein [Zunongwangia endophytica]|uniref:Exosortase F system-associated protein n=1 Tax=Zunongwangia endophytica TaxID=1808945 RepID=A0ABV8H8S0_9FLAO|nr:exosortase F system-associated protein [Zunongwangia endophytica]MDN3596349.1 exosortase F system-associated protein [Zunongwangia endophytica]
MKTRYRIFFIGILVVVLAAIRYYESIIFYDPLIDFFKYSDYLRDRLPDFDHSLLILNTFFRYTLNSLISIAILAIAFIDRNIVKFATVLFLLLLVLAGSVFTYLVFTIENEHFLALFYVRRFLIHPIFILVLLPAFYYYRMNNHAKKSV